MRYHHSQGLLLLLVLLLFTVPGVRGQEGMAYREWPVAAVISAGTEQVSQEVSLKPGEAVKVELFSAGGTGYGWELSPESSPLLTAVYTNTQEIGAPNLTGGPVKTVYILSLSPEARETAQVDFVLIRPWEKNSPPAKAFHLVVNPVQKQFLDKEQSILRRDGSNRAALPEAFRVLPELKASGSAQYSSLGLQQIKENLPQDHIILVDLRQESHGFINGIPISWYEENNWGNVGKAAEEVVAEERQLLAQLADSPEVILYKSLKKDKKTGALLSGKAEMVKPDELYTEEELAQSLNLGYFRLAVTDHRRPLDADVDKFIEFVRDLPPDVWLHFHCEAGHGRTTTFLAMYDMMLNAKSNTFEEIVSRQHDAGGIDLSAANEKDWRRAYDQERLVFLKQFYEYCKANHDQFTTSWSVWLEQDRSKGITAKDGHKDIDSVQ